MPDFPAYTRDELTERGRSLLLSRRRGIDVSLGSDYDLWARMLGALAWGEQKRAEQLLLNLDPRRASGGYLATYAAELAVGRDVTETSTAATYAGGTVILTSNTGGETLPAGTVLRHADGTEYTLDADVTLQSVASAKVLRAGHLSSASRLYQGHVGGGFVMVDVGEVYRAARTTELLLVQDADNQAQLTRYLVDFATPTSEAPELHDTYVQQPGASASVTAKEPGERGNKEPGDALTVLAPVGGVSAQARIVALSGGADAMQPAEVRAAIAALLGTRAPTGTLADIRELCLSAPGLSLSECYVLPALSGLSTYTLLPVRADGQYVGTADCAKLVAYVSARTSPVDRFEALSGYEVFDTRIDVLNVQVAAQYAPDFSLPDETEPGIALTAATVSTLSLARAVPGLFVGARIIVTTRGSSGAYIVVRRVVSIADDEITLDTPLPFPPDIGDSYVTPGGALAVQIVDALYAAYSAQAPGMGDDDAARIRYPEAPTSDKPEGILRTVSDVEGVTDVAFTSGSAPSLLYPGGVLVPVCTIRMFT